MQNIFAFKQCQQANFNIAKDLIKVQFSPDLNSMEPQNADELKEKKKVALELFENNYLDKDIPASKVSSSELLEAAQGAVDFYYKQAKKDMDFLRKTMVKSAEDIHNTYLLLLLLLVEIAELEEADIEEKKQKALKKNLTVDLTSLTYSSNKIIMMIKQHKELQIEALRNKVDWSGQRDLLKQVYKELSKTAEFLKYTEGKEHSFEEDKDFVLSIVKNFIFKNELIKSFLEEDDLNWGENHSIVKSMVLKTIKSITPEDETFELMALASNWEDDKIFFIDIFDLTIEKDREYEELIAGKTKNWDIERVAALDKVILKMALNEMLNFPSIPIKVTINEYIEISKNYSTPKSRQFINGILDVVADELQSEGKIRKSGRGLIDNK
jgi:N utilization substance protein B